MPELGRTCWAIAGGHIPLRSAGPEPELTSRDQLALLNTGRRPTEVRITIHYADQDPVGPHCLVVQPRRVRKLRFNDLIEPLPIPLDTPFAAVIESDRPIIVQFLRQDTSSPNTAILGTMGYGED